MRGLFLLPFLGVVACTGGPILDETRLPALEQISAEVDGARVMEDVRTIVTNHGEEAPLDCALLFDVEAVDLVRRPLCNLTRDHARTLVRERFEALGLEVRTQDTEDGALSTSNVVADLKGTERPDEIVLVGAHFDAFHAGADDNTSGLAAMLELARVLSQHRFARTIRFIGFDLEELGLVGSTRYVANGFADEQVVAAIVFDCIGYSDPTPGSQGALPGLPVPSTGDFLAIIGNDSTAQEAAQVRTIASRLGIMKTETVIAPDDGAFPLTGNLLRSDHAPFWLDGRPALFLTDTANFRNPNYHTDHDTVETLDPGFLAGVTRVSAAALALWAEERR